MSASGQRFRRSCDVCGDDTWTFDRMTTLGNGQIVCPYDARGWTADDIEQQGPVVLFPPIKPRENAMITNDLELYQKAEAEVFNLILRLAPSPYLDITNGDGDIP